MATTYPVTYSANGGSGAPAPQQKQQNVPLKLSTIQPVRPGYTFLGWNIISTATTVIYRPGATYVSNAPLHLYAVWQPNPTVIIEYDAGSGTGAPEAQRGLGGTTIYLSSIKPTWASETGGSITITYDPVEEDATLSRYTDNLTMTMYHTFVGWNTEADYTGTAYLAGAAITLPNTATTIHLYAMWETTEYTTLAEHGLELPIGSLAQYTLTGLAVKPNYPRFLTPYTKFSESKTIYAQWRVSDYGGMLRLPKGDETALITSDLEGKVVRIVGLNDSANDGIYHVASVDTLTNDYVYMYFDEDFKSNGQQDAEELDLYIYDDGVHVPEMDYICAWNNRLWGCSSRMRTIYASALGDPTDFLTFNGMSTDAYYTPVGTAGDFTGCCELNNNVLFMKQHCIHKVLGSFPAEYALYTYDYDGVSESNALSLVNCDGTAVFVSEHGIGTYAGATTGILSKALGEGGMHNAMAGYNGEKYSLYYQDDAGTDHSYEYDMRYGIWIEKNYGKVLSYAHLVDDDFVLVEDPDRNAVYKVNTDMELDGDWEILYRDFYEMVTGSYKSQSMIFEKKRYTSLTFRLELPEGSWIKAYVKADDGEWHPMMKLAGNAMRVASYRIMTPRCDRLKLRLSGHGPMRLLGLERDFTIGSRR